MKGIALFGAKSVGASALAALRDEGVPINSVITVTGEGGEELRNIAHQLNVPLFLDLNLNDPAERERVLSHQPFAGMSVSYPKKIPAALLERFPGRSFNFHPARLPEYRGCFPTIWPILNGDYDANYTMHVMDEDFDAGPLVDCETLTIEERETGWSLYLRLVSVLPNLIRRNLESVLMGRCQVYKQDDQKARYYPNRLPHDATVDWAWSGEEIDRFVRALYHPVFAAAKARVNNAEVEIIEAEFIRHDVGVPHPGSVTSGSHGLTVSCKNGWVRLKTIRFEGKPLFLNDASETLSIFQ